MSLYASNITNLKERKVNHIFYFEDKNLFHINRDLGIENETTFNDSVYPNILIIAEKEKINEFEILLPFDIDNLELTSLLKMLTNYLLDKDIIIGLICQNNGFLARYQELLSQFGVSFYSGKLREIIYEKEVHKVYRKTGTVHSFGIDECALLDACSIPLLEESFFDKLIRFLNESNKTNKEVYTNGGITRQLFSKIISRKSGIPTKNTIICLIIGMELCYKDAQELLLSAGYALSKSILFDSIVMKYLKNGIFDLERINDELYENNLPLLGWHPR